MKKVLTITASVFLLMILAVACSSDPYEEPTLNATVKFIDSRYNTVTEVNATSKDGVKLPVPENTADEVFVGWSEKKDGTAEDLVASVDGVFYPTRDGSYTLYAVWAKQRVTLYFHYNYSNSEEMFSTTTVDYHTWSTVSDPGTPVNSDKITFAGWYTSPTAGEGNKLEADITKLPLEDTHYYAQWAKPVTLTWNANGTTVTTTSNAFAKVVLPENPADSEESRFVRWLDEEEKEVTANTIIYSDESFTALFGERVEITYMKDSTEKLSIEADNNYEYFNYVLPTPSEEDISAFAGWKTEDGRIITENDIVTKDITVLYAESGIIVEVLSTGSIDRTGSVVFATGHKAANRIMYPSKGNYAPAAVIQVELGDGTKADLIDLNGNFIPDVSGYTDENGAWIYEGEAAAVKLSVEWTDARKVGGVILFKNRSNATSEAYTFYDENYIKLEETFVNNVPTYSGTPVYYSVDGGYGKEYYTEIADSGYVVVYNDNDNSMLKTSIRYTSSNDNIDVETLRKFNTSGFENTQLIKDELVDEGTNITAYVKEVKKDSIAWFIPSLYEISYLIKGGNQNTSFGITASSIRSVLNDNSTVTILLSSVQNANTKTFDSLTFSDGFSNAPCTAARNLFLIKLI